MDAMKNLMKQLKESGTHSNINYGSQICQLSPLWDEQFYGCKREDQRNTTMVACLHALYLGTWSLMEPKNKHKWPFPRRISCHLPDPLGGEDFPANSPSSACDSPEPLSELKP